MHDTAAEERGAISPTDSYKLLVLGGGTAGSTVASKFAKKLGKRNIAVIEPSKVSVKCIKMDGYVRLCSILSCW